jgi:hypothetical protein
MATSEYVYIDGAYFRGVVEDLAKRYNAAFDINYGVLFRQFEKKFYYDCRPPRRKGEGEAEHQARIASAEALFDELLETDGFRVHLGQIAGEGERMRQKGVDVSSPCTCFRTLTRESASVWLSSPATQTLSP